MIDLETKKKKNNCKKIAPLKYIFVGHQQAHDWLLFYLLSPFPYICHENVNQIFISGAFETNYGQLSNN